MILRVQNIKSKDTQYFNKVERFYTEYQPQNNKSYWIFIILEDLKEFAIEWNPKTEEITVWNE